MAAAEAPRCVAVAVSGGRDSTALLHATAVSARALGLQVAALHVHHGLSLHADDWVRHLQRQCARWRRAGLPVALHVLRLTGRPGPTESVEAWARRERYAALTRMAREQGVGLVLLAHHRRDQAETVVLQALRGGGSAGLSAMPREIHREGLLWARPWLDQPSAAIGHYIQRHRLSHIEDDSNADPRFARNRLRQAVWPALLERFADAESRLCDLARQAQRETALRDEVAAEDLHRVREPAGALALDAWCALSAARRWYCLRAWLLDAGLPQAPERLLERLTGCLSHQPAGAGVCPAGQGWQVRWHRGLLTLHPPPAQAAADAAACLPDFSRPGALRWGAGLLRWQWAEEGGIAPQHLHQAVVRTRLPGDQFQHGRQGIPRALKKQFQASCVPRWERDGPLVESAAGQLVWVAALGVDGRLAPTPPGAGWRLSWEPAQAPGHSGASEAPAHQLE